MAALGVVADVDLLHGVDGGGAAPIVLAGLQGGLLAELELGQREGARADRADLEHALEVGVMIAIG